MSITRYSREDEGIELVQIHPRKAIIKPVPVEAKQYTGEQYYQLYHDYLQKYLNQVRQPGDLTFGHLYHACQYLIMAALSGNVQAKIAVKHTSQKILSHELQKACDLEFLCRLKEVSPGSFEYIEAQSIKFMLYYSQRYSTVYSDYKVRLNEIHSALASISLVSQRHPLIETFLHQTIAGYPCELNASKLSAGAWKILIMELMGENSYFALFKQHLSNEGIGIVQDNYPFRVMSKHELELLLKEAMPNQPEIVDQVFYDIREYANAHLIKIVCKKASSNKYLLSTTVAELKASSGGTICFFDQENDVEVARIALVDNQLKFNAHGNTVQLTVNGKLEAPVCIFENPLGDISFMAEWATKKASYLGVDTQTFNYCVNGHSTKPLRFESRGVIELEPRSRIHTEGDFSLQATTARALGKIEAQGVAQFETAISIEAGPESECSAKAGIIVLGGSLKDIRGRFVTEGILKVEADDSIYLHSTAAFHAKSGIMLKGKQFYGTDKASFKSEGVIKIEMLHDSVFDKECVVEVLLLTVRARRFKNYSPYVSSKKMVIHADEDARNYPTGVLTTQEALQVMGGDFWNGGHISYGQILKAKLNGFFVHGVAEASDLLHLKKTINKASIKGGDASIIAGAVIDTLGSKEVRSWNTSAIAEIDLDWAIAKNSRKSRLFALDFGVSLPNMSQLLQDGKTFFNTIKQGNVKALLTGDNLIGLTSFARWVVRNTVPVAGKSVDLVWSVLMFIYSTPRVYADLQNLYQRGKDIEKSDLYSLLATSSSLMTQATSLETQVMSAMRTSSVSTQTDISSESKLSDPTEHPQTTAPKVTNDHPSDQETDDSSESKDHDVHTPTGTSAVVENDFAVLIPSLSMDFVSLFAPVSTDEALFEAKMGGFRSGGTLLKRTLFGYDLFSTEVALNITHLFYHSGQQGNFVLASNLSDVGDTLKRSNLSFALTDSTNVVEQQDTSTVYSGRLSWINQNLEEKAHVTTRHGMLFSANTLDHQGHMVSKYEITAYGKTVTTGVQSVLHSDQGNASIISNNAHIAGDVNAKVVHIKAEDHLDLDKSSHLASTPDGAVAIEAKTASFGAVIQSNEIDLRIDHGLNVDDLLLQHGIFKDVHPDKSLNVWTKDAEDFNRDMDLSYSLLLSSATMTFNNSFHSSQNIVFYTTEGDLIVNGVKVLADGVLSINTKGNFVNQQGNVSGTQFFVNTQGSALNYGGILQGYAYLQILAGGNIEDRCLEQDVKGPYDRLKKYTPGQFIAGKGGFVGYAKGKAINDASVIHSEGANQFSGDQGTDMLSRSYRAVTYHREHTTWLGHHSETTVVSTFVQAPVMYSGADNNTLVSKQGRVYSCGTQFITPKGETVIDSNENPVLTGLVAQKNVNKSNSNLWGAVHDNTKQMDQYAVPTVLYSLNGAQVNTPNILVLSNAAIVSPGKLAVNAKDIDFSQPTLKHTYTEDNQAFGIKFPSIPGLNSIPLYSDIRTAIQSNNSGELATNSWNTLVDGVNTANQFISAYRMNSLAQAIFPTSAMTAVELDLTRTRTSYQFQTLPTNTGVFVGEFEFNTPNGSGTVNIANGFSILSTGNGTFHAKKVFLNGAELKSSMSTDSQSVGVGASAEGKPTFSAAVSQSSTTVTNHIPALLNVGGQLDFGELDELNLNGGVINAVHVKGHVKRTTLVSQTDTTSSECDGIQASTTGDFAAQHNASRSSTVNAVSAINVQNSDGLTLDEVYSKGGRVALGAGNSSIGHMDSQSVEECSKSSSFGLSGNINNFTNNTSSWAWNQAIPTLTVQVGKQDYEDNLLPTVISQSGATQLQSLTGPLNTQNTDGRQVIRNTHYDYTVKVPLYHPEGLQAFKDNLDWLGSQIKPSQMKQSANDFEIKRTSAPVDAERKADTAENKRSSDESSIDSRKVEKYHPAKASQAADEEKDNAPTLTPAEETMVDKAQQTASLPIPQTAIDYSNVNGNTFTMFHATARGEASRSKTESKSRETMASPSSSEPPRSSGNKWERILSANDEVADAEEDLVFRTVSGDIRSKETWKDINTLLDNSELGAPVRLVKGAYQYLKRTDEEMKAAETDLAVRLALGKAMTKGGLHDVVTIASDASMFTPIGIGVEVKATEGVVAGAARLVDRFGMWVDIKGSTTSIYHTTKTVSEVQGILDGIDPFYFKPNNRFGEAFYLSELPDTTLAELNHHSKIGVATIRYVFNKKSADLLDLTNPKIAKEWSYIGGEITPAMQEIGLHAKELGYDGIRFKSERGVGDNIAIFKNFDQLLTPQMVVKPPIEIQNLTIPRSMKLGS